MHIHAIDLKLAVRIRLVHVVELFYRDRSDGIFSGLLDELA